MRATDPISSILEARLAGLQAEARLSAWSLIVSFLGDAIGPRGGVVSATALQALMQRLGVGAGAVRTALSRLAAEGWIERTREGRNGFYSLAGAVGETVLAAERRIYAGSSLLPADTPRCLVIAASALPEEALPAIDAAWALRLAPHVLLCFAAAEALPPALRFDGATLADRPRLIPGHGLTGALAEARQSAEMARLHEAYAPLHQALEAGAAPAPEDAIALRCLMIHEWRRLALKVLAVPSDLVHEGDPEPATRALVAGIYARLLPASEAWLDAHATTPSGPLPAPDARLARRFAAG
ncbi:PaaX family transcriptional regulator C-terminal domain-containing protein [Hoeflea olei]|uniref:PaaX family transcriptional regulator n=1 Tax=Hoeflea olei TaxID=1480615 RepID=A0A1C1YWB8_9HYPH|nr:PaaX family transcriptional regulator C-terminal domain-containing protein [Hoeflea olei]OCW57777.1 hypothetical protein AWJ14_02965 [Hoeflea olei]